MQCAVAIVFPAGKGRIYIGRSTVSPVFFLAQHICKQTRIHGRFVENAVQQLCIAIPATVRSLITNLRIDIPTAVYVQRARRCERRGLGNNGVTVVEHHAIMVIHKRASSFVPTGHGIPAQNHRTNDLLCFHVLGTDMHIRSKHHAFCIGLFGQDFTHGKANVFCIRKNVAFAQVIENENLIGRDFAKQSTHGASICNGRSRSNDIAVNHCPARFD